MADRPSANPPQPAAHGYSEPPAEIVALVDAARPPLAVASPCGLGVLLVEVESHPPLVHVAEPVLRLAGIRLSPARGSRQHLQYGKRLEWVRCEDGTRTAFTLPADARIGLPVFAPGGSVFALTHDTPEGTELWLGDASTCSLKQV
ncbi:MAG: hypothetical protein ACOVK6_09305, partial [Ramlibacter sp.]